MKELSGIVKVKQVYRQGYSREDNTSGDKRLLKVLDIVSSLGTFGKVKSLLDIGCGDGFFTVQLGERLKITNLLGVDIAEKAVGLAKKRGINARRVDIDLNNLPFKSKSCDMVFSGSLIELIADPDHLLLEIHRVLADGGFCIITVPNMCAWGSRLAVLLGFLPYYFRVSTRYDLGKMFTKPIEGRSTGFIRLQSLYSFRELVRLYGFKVEMVYGAAAAGLPVGLEFIDRFFVNFPGWAFQMIFVLKKQ